MRKKSNDGDGRPPRRAGSRGSSRKRKASAGENSTAGSGPGTGSKSGPRTAAGNTGGSSSGASRSVDRRALQRILTWLLETNTEQQSLILSAMDMVSDPQEASANPTERSTSPGALLRAILAERTAAVLHPPAANK